MYLREQALTFLQGFFPEGGEEFWYQVQIVIGCGQVGMTQVHAEIRQTGGEIFSLVDPTDLNA